MSVNGLTLQNSAGSLPFVPLGDEVVSGPTPVVKVRLWPVTEDRKPLRKSSTPDLEFPGRLFITSQRLVFLNSTNTHAVRNLVILYRQLTLSGTEQTPIGFGMPWFGPNYLKFSFNVLPEQSLHNGPWLDPIHAWQCELTLQNGSGPIRDLFQLHDLINAVMASSRTSVPPEDDEQLPQYTP
ncbi:LANO_0H17524g1_1 [Lachancea nothofagi CBS 11611]|uniref:LANO_0H17524g1_1 n=1 Tax=Lachancea nothofagi CBS 11611 TaxID=1266666 RepID=A0A1G4KMV7_9SACH|nr:LANO_0H17524g1_1 [Lachancea nothofagi CBS 11611]